MLARKNLSRLRLIVLTVVIAVVWVVIGLLVYRTFVHPSSAPEAAGPAVPMPVSDVSKLPATLSLDLLRDPRLTELKVFGQLPLEVGPMGRANPFAPIIAAGSEANLVR